MTTRILLNGSIYTPTDPYATAILTENNIVRWAGSDAGARSIADSTMELIDLKGRLVTPTFTRALAPTHNKTTKEILDYLTTAHYCGYHTHTLTAEANTLNTLLEATQKFTHKTGTHPDIRLLINIDTSETNPTKLTETIAKIRHTLPATQALTLAGLHATNTAPINTLAHIASEEHLILSLNSATNFTQTLTTALLIRDTHPWLPLRLDYTKPTPTEPITDAQLQKLANARITLCLQSTHTTAQLAHRANTTGTSTAIGSDPTLSAPMGWNLAKIFVTHPNGTSARSAFAALTRGAYRALNEQNPFIGQLVPDTPANLAIWNVTELMVQAPDSRVASWSTDPRARIPLLPVLDDAPLPTLDILYTAEQ